MANATAVLVLEAKDHATAQLKAFGANVQEAGRQAEKASVNTAKMGGSVGSLLDRVKAAQIPLRNVSAILGGFGLSFIGIAAATRGMMGLIGQAMAADRAFLTVQLNMRRFGFSLDEAANRARELRSVLGTTAMVELAGMVDEFEKWRIAQALTAKQGNDVLKLLKEYAKWTGTDLPAAFKELLKHQEIFGDAEGIKSFAEAVKGAEKNASDLQKQLIRVGEIWGPIGEKLATGALWTFSNLAEGINIVATLWAGLESDLKESVKLWGRIFEEIGNQLKTPFQSVWNWIKADWAKGIEIDLPAPIISAITWINAEITKWGPILLENLAKPFQWFGEYMANSFWPWLSGIFARAWEGIIKSGAEMWGGFLGFWVSLGKNLADFWIERWTAIGKWWVELTTGIASFWRGVWEGMKGIGISVYNFIVDRLNDALTWANSVIRAINSALGRIGLGIPEISLRIARATMPAPEAVTAMPSYTAPGFATPIGGTIIIPITIGDKAITEIIIDTLTGAVRQRELSE